MIQRKQTLFLLELVFLSIALLFVPASTIITFTSPINVALLPVGGNYSTTAGHLVAMLLNFAGLILAIATIFSYRKRELQVKLCYVLVIIWLVLGLMTTFCPFVIKAGDIIDIQSNFSDLIISIFAILAAFLAARFIQKDIDLLKSADRIR